MVTLRELFPSWKNEANVGVPELSLEGFLVAGIIEYSWLVPPKRVQLNECRSFRALWIAL